MATLALERNIDRICRRIRLLLAVRWSVLFALAGAAASLVALVAVKLARAPFPIELDGLFLVACAGLGALFGCFRRVTPFQAALATDARLGLKERLSSAVALLRAPEPEPMVDALVADATLRSEKIDVRAVYPVRIPREARFLGGALVALALAILLPSLPIFQSAQQKAERSAMKAEGERIVRIAKEVRKASDTRHAELNRRIARNLEQLGKEMRSARIGKKQAMVRLNKLTKEVSEAQRKLALAGGAKSLKQAGEELRKGAKAAEAGAQSRDPAKRLQQMADALSKGDTQKAAKLLQEMANRAASGKMSADELRQMASEAQKMAQALSGTQLAEAAKQLREAAKQLQQGQMAAAAQQMKKAAGT